MFLTACLFCLATKSYLTLLQLHEPQPARLLYPWDLPGKNTGVGCHFLLQGIFLTQGSDPSLLHWQADSLPLTLWTVARQAPLSMGFSRQEYWNGLPFPSPGDLLAQGWNLGLLYCRWILYRLSHQGSPRSSIRNRKIFTVNRCWG